jgi:hypothetical protein
MQRALPATLLFASVVVPAAAQDVFQSSPGTAYHWRLESLGRQEWTDETTFVDDKRSLLRVKPRFEVERGRFALGVGGDFTYGSDRNTEEAPGTPPGTQVTLVRDNYKSRDARLDLAFARVSPASWLTVQGGRFAMPLRTTEMIWDRDLRPQGAAVVLQLPKGGSIQKLTATGVFARGSHVFPRDGGAFQFDDRDTVWMASLGATLGAGGQGDALELTGSYLRFTDLGVVSPLVRRQNTRVGGALVLEYDVVDLVARYRTERGVPFQLVADYAFNTSADADNRGLWLAVVIGSVRSARAVLEYTYARMDKDVTLAAYATDDFIWGTGWEGHRGDLGFRTGEHASIHVVGQLQRCSRTPVTAARMPVERPVAGPSAHQETASARYRAAAPRTIRRTGHARGALGGVDASPDAAGAAASRGTRGSPARRSSSVKRGSPRSGSSRGDTTSP